MQEKLPLQYHNRHHDQVHAIVQNLVELREDDFGMQVYQVTPSCITSYVEEADDIDASITQSLLNMLFFFNFVNVLGFDKRSKQANTIAII